MSQTTTRSRLEACAKLPTLLRAFAERPTKSARWKEFCKILSQNRHVLLQKSLELVHLKASQCKFAILVHCKHCNYLFVRISSARFKIGMKKAQAILHWKWHSKKKDNSFSSTFYENVSFMTEQQFSKHNSTFKMQIQNSMNANPRQPTKWDKVYKTMTKWTYSITTLKLQCFSIWRRAWEQEWLDDLQVVSLTDVQRVSEHEISQSPQGISHSSVGSFAFQPMGRQPALLLFGQPYIFSTSWWEDMGHITTM